MIRYETSRLIIREHEEKDIEPYFEMFNTKENTKLTPYMHTETIDVAKKAIYEAILYRYETPRIRYFYVIETKQSDYVGEIGFTVKETTDLGDIVEIGYFLTPAMQGKGYATEATVGLIEHIFKTMKVIRIEASCAAINLKSKQVIEKSGFIFEAIRRRCQYLNGDIVDRLYYSLVSKEEWSV